MAAHAGPNVVDDGLILSLDAANSKCFTSGETTCINLITGNQITGANGQPNAGAHTPNSANFPAFSSDGGGCFDFAGGRGMNVEENLGPQSAMTLDMWYYKNSSGTQYFTDARNNGGGWFLSNYQSANINFYSQATYNFGGSYDASNPDFINRWQHMCFTAEDTGASLYIDGVEVYSIVTTILCNLGANFRIGTRYTTATEWTGKMGPIKVYNRKLTANEAAQNYNAAKGRFI